MNDRQIQAVENRDISSEVAALEHVAAGVERYTTLPTSELLKDIDVLEIEEKLAGSLDEAYRPLLGAVRAARLLESESAEDLRRALEIVSAAQRRVAERGGDADR
jgi:hypothetical protein